MSLLIGSAHPCYTQPSSISSLLDREANQEHAMVHVCVKVVVVLLKDVLKLSLHHSFARARVVAVAANDLVDVLVLFPVWFDVA